jgi:hypothetical protein
VDSLVSGGTLGGAIRIPNAVAPLQVELDLRANRVTCLVEVDAPREGRPTTRVNWMVRQLKSAPESLRLEAFASHARGASMASLLKEVREDPAVLVQDPKKEIRTFRVALTTQLGSKRGRGRGSAIDSVLDAADAFYGDVLQHLKAWTAAPPKMREVNDLPDDRRPALVSTALSSQDGTEPVMEGTDQEASIETEEESEGPVLESQGL